MEAKSFYDFKNFRLDLEERVLLHDGVPISITPKVFDLLKVLIENRGRVIEKDELMAQIWKGSFVEESNLAFNIRQLRKALDDNARQPTFIETVPKRGYRFIAEVNEIVIENESNNGAARTISQPAEKPPSDSIKLKKFLFPVAAILIVGVVFIVFWYAKSRNLEVNAPILFMPFASEKLSTNGKVVHAVITQDGKNVIYTNGSVSDKQSVWLRQLEEGANVEIIPPSDDTYAGLALSPDGKLLYFVRQARQTGEPFSIYRVSIFGGIPQKIISETEGWINLSPDGSRISFVRCPYRDDEYCSLWIADAADGRNEKRLVSRQRPFRIADNRFSPDGKTIAFGVGQSATGSNEFGLSEVDLESGTERELTGEKFFNIKNLAWLPDKSGLLLTARKSIERNFRIWQVSTATGEAAPLTKDSETYLILNLDKEASRLVSTQVKQDFRLRIINPDHPSLNQTLANANSAQYAPDGKIYFSSIMSGNGEIWSINADGGNRRQLTNTAADENSPVISSDNNSVFFASNRTGAAHVWRMNPDGSNQTQITQKEGGAPVFVSPDGEWVYYVHGLTGTLWRVGVKTGEEQMVLNKTRTPYALSPDGSQVAFVERQGDEGILIIASLADGQTVKTFRPSDKKSLLPHIAWMPDGKTLAYISANREYENHLLWLQSLDGGMPRQIAALGDEELSGLGVAVAPDGKTFAVAQGAWLHDAVLLKGLK